MRALSGFIGFKGSSDRRLSQLLNGGAQRRPAVDTGFLECGMGMRNSRCSGEMLRYREELRSRRQRAGPLLTFRLESAGIKQD